jgi:formylglycine-generating enzyme required for sulfatase activity
MTIPAKTMMSFLCSCTMIVIAAGWYRTGAEAKEPSRFSPAVITVEPRLFHYRKAGEFNRDGRPVAAPLVTVKMIGPLVVMQHLVTAQDYQRCVEASRCTALPPASPMALAMPAVGVSWMDASSYARWLSDMTQQIWRLPTDEEWAFVAGSRFNLVDNVPAASDNPASGWLSRYERDYETAPANSVLKLVGAHGPNEFGLTDLSENVWEWTSTCFAKWTIDASGKTIAEPLINCGVRAVQGRHRTYMTFFLRDAKAGGCSMGKPPDHLGFRLVREADKPLFERMRQWFQ